MPLSRKPHPKFTKDVPESKLITSVRIHPDLYERFAAYAKRERLSKSAAINRILEEHFNRILEEFLD